MRAAKTSAIRGLLLASDSSTTILTGGHASRKCGKYSSSAGLSLTEWYSGQDPLGIVSLRQRGRLMTKKNE
jgi:hypothetical protein